MDKIITEYKVTHITNGLRTNTLKLHNRYEQVLELQYFFLKKIIIQIFKRQTLECFAHGDNKRGFFICNCWR